MIGHVLEEPRRIHNKLNEPQKDGRTAKKFICRTIEKRNGWHRIGKHASYTVKNKNFFRKDTALPQFKDRQITRVSFSYHRIISVGFRNVEALSSHL